MSTLPCSHLRASAIDSNCVHNIEGAEFDAGNEAVAEVERERESSVCSIGEVLMSLRDRAVLLGARNKFPDEN